ncbi:DedA family protein [Mangrovibacillus cuniculi]|uniref:Alkaline phosphatase n=1 Tax=Mangrovibacillus cuniculi TaxID=2593652 RepID=A0A7S8CAR9_9BACI|nr:hypothetical protein [Mangrovibacillus cuniculi]QPC46540.1 hypothetical protein G8O30_05950 [Mangrovibacillus cuniculi]
MSTKQWWKRAEKTFEKYEDKALILSISLPGLRLAVPFLAGVKGISVKTFYLYSTLPVTLWACGYFLLGFWYFPIASEQPWLFIPVFLVYVAALALRSILLTKKSPSKSHLS